MRDPEPLEGRRRHAVEQLRGHSRIVVALSGGVDSAVLLALAVEALGRDRVLGVTGCSPAVADEEVEDARGVAARLGVRHVAVPTNEFENEEYLANRKDRCYHCRSELFTILTAIARDQEGSRIAYGAILDDLADDRPGMAAARERGILAPLLDAGLTKADVRELARSAGIPVEAKPANACLASRIPHGVRVTRERLAQVARAERGIRDLGFPLVRVRHHGERASIEVPPEDLSQLRSQETEIADVIAEAGFRDHAIDPDGYRRGSAGPGPLYSIVPQREGGQ